MAEDWVSQTFFYAIRQDTGGMLRFEMPVYDQDDSDTWITDGKIYYQVGDGPKQIFFEWGVAENNIAYEATHVNTNLKSSVDGSVVLLRSENTFFPDFDVDMEKGRSYQHWIYRQTQQTEHYLAIVNWTVPRELRGKTITFSYDVNQKGNGNHQGGKKVVVPSKTIDMSASPTVMQPIVSQAMVLEEKEYQGKIVVPWMIPVDSAQVKRVVAVYTDNGGVERTMTQEINSSGFALLWPDQAYRNFHIVCDYLDSEGYEMRNVSSDSEDIAMIHSPEDFTATAQNDSKAKINLTWKIKELNYEDMLDGDVFQIQRSLSGRDEDFVDIGFEMLDLSKEEYSFVDSTIVESLTKENVNQVTGDLNVTYRIRRGVTSIWGWEWGAAYNPTVKKGYTKGLRPLRLTQVDDAFAYWKNKEEHTVNVQWSFYQDKQCCFVWDDRAEIDLVVKMYNRNNELVDSMIYQLSENEIKAKRKEITLPRSCVRYKISFVTKRGNSPIPYYNAEFISSAEDWEKAAQKVKNGEKDLKLVLESDITLPEDFTPLGVDYYTPFTGTIEGNGYTITVNTRNPLIREGNHCTISNLVIAGTNSGMHSAALAEELYNTQINNCIVKVNFTSESFNQGYNEHKLSGFCNNTIAVEYNNCLFAGSVSNATLWSGFDGDPDGAKFKGCLNAPQKCEKISSGWDFYNEYNTDNHRPKQFDNCFYTSSSTLRHQGELLPESVDEQLERLGSGWVATEEWPGIMPVLPTEKADNSVTTEAYIDTSYEGFYFESSGKVSKHIETQTLQSSVLITWETDGGVIDFFQVWRTEKGKNQWNPIADNITELSYEDTTVSPILTYEYKVLSAVDCEGTHTESSDVAEGHCEPTGMVEGYLRYADGTAIPNMKIVATLNDVTVASTYTDSKGYYMIDKLSYNGQMAVSYTIAPVSDPETQGTITLEEKSYQADFKASPGSNYMMLKDFIVTSGFSFSGFVFYEGTKIPVRDVGFLVNGKQVLTASGANVTTDHEGKFSFRVFQDVPLEIKPIMAGHVFNSKQVYNHVFKGKVDEYYFYDDTKVKLIGRMVGGLEQGSLPLDNSLSRNNLGDNLQMTLALEGDNNSWLVYDNKNSNRTERDTVFAHVSHDNVAYQTKMHTTRRQITVTPDPKTGEYVAYLPPVKWKVQHLSGTGYPTLFPEGKISDVIDLTEALEEKSDSLEGNWTTLTGKQVVHKVGVTYNAIYNCIYHTPTQLTYKQLGLSNFGFLGDETYVARNLAGDKVTVPLVYQVPTQPNLPEDTTTVMVTKYTFGYPVFSIEKKYPIRLSAVEKYYWNNNQRSDTVDIVRLSGGKVTIHNGMVGATHSEEVELDSLGQALVKLDADKVPYLLTQKDALRTVNMTLERDGTRYEAEPIKAYILNIYAMKEGTDILSVNQPVLVDILRDPPGSGSSATLSKGSTLKYSYSMDMNWAAGLELSIKKGTALASFYGAVAAPMGAGVVSGVNSGAETSFETSLALMFSGSGKRAFEYSMTASEDISTSGSGDVVGADGDVYIGVEQNIVVKPAYTIRAIPHSHFLQMGGQLAAKRAIEIAQGRDENDSIYHLVRDESLTYGPMIQSTFHHSQQYLTSTLIPGLVNQCKSLMFTGTLAEAKAQADRTGKPVYLALVDPSDEEHFGVMNKKNGQYYRYTSRMAEESGMNYRIVMPSDMKDDDLTDEVQQYCASLQSWIGMIAQNEGEKLAANELVRNFVVDGGVGSVSYEEEFSSDYSCMNSMVWPVSGLTDGYFDSTAGNTALTIVQVVGPTVAKFLGSILSASKGGINSGSEFGGKVEFVGALFEFGLTPALSYEVTPEWETSKSYSRKESFSIGMELKSHLSFDVYRVKNIVTENMAKSDLDVFTSENFYEQVNYDEEYLKRHLDLTNAQYARGFVYRTRGGATCRPWEDERRTLFYQPGQLLDEATKKIENPVIKLDKQTISGVPHTEPARFKLYLTNETEQPENTYDYYHLYMEEASNPKGAKLLVDGVPLSGSGRTVKVLAGEITEKTLEVYAGEDFDYEDLVVGLCSVDGEKFADSEASLDVHFLRAAGSINIASPGDKWILNTDAQYDEKYGYYLPIIIDGFDKNQKNFDHIEFQYKETARGDEFWTNLCAYYASDSLYTLANGVKEMIPENGSIITRFFGEKIIMEKAYDLRAVLFCRNGNGYLTSSSKVLSGVKDTRRPTIFGTPEPKDGIIDIGDDVVFNFSEDIEYNYLNTANFEVKGEVNNDHLTDDVTIRFDNKSSLETTARRNFNGKDLTLEVMIQPDETGEDMPIFSHGTSGKKLQLWYTKEHRLKAVVNNETLTSDREISIPTLSKVAMVIRHLSEAKDSACMVELYHGGIPIGSKEIQNPYTSTGTLIFGRTNEVDRLTSSYFKGRMMEARLWYRALSDIDLNETKRLTGYELGLVDYYPMNEGNGEYAMDHAQGANAVLHNASWQVPRGMSLHIDWEDKGIPLNNKFINRNKYEDFTLMFWFRTDADGRGVLFSNGSGEAADSNAENQIYIGFDAEKLNFKYNGHLVNVPGDYSDNQWHHYAMTVNRGLNLGKILVDNTLRATFTVDSLGGVSGGHPMFGSAVFERMEESGLVIADTRNYLRGNLDEICVFEQALPESLIKAYSTKSPHGDEAGLLSYLNFSQQVRSTNNQLEMRPYAWSSKIYKDENGNIRYELDENNNPTTTPERDFLFDESVVSEENILKHIDQTLSAPVRPYEELTNISYSYVGKGNQIYFNINESDTRINKRNIYITVRDIPDKNGNAMASPVTAYYFVDCNPLRWVNSYELTKTVKGNKSSLALEIANNSGVRHTYTIENCPRWLKLSKTTDVIGPRQNVYLVAEISEHLNVGTYDEILYLTDENGMSEPFGLTVTVEGVGPNWLVDPSLLQHTMNVIAQVRINDEIDIDSNDIVGVFDDNNVCHGVANIGNGEDQHLVYINIYNDEKNSKAEQEMHFRLWHSATGNEMLLNTAEKVFFKRSSILGTVESPLILNGGSQYVQTINLHEGWNWISFNVYGERFFDINKLLSSYDWSEGDIFTDNNSDMTFAFNNGKWLASDDASKFILLPTSSYAVKVKEGFSLSVGGTIIRQKLDRTIELGSGWNGIGYTPMMNLTLETALEDYADDANDGDIIKSHDAFAVFSKPSPTMKGVWKGSLQYLKPGEGYMFMRNAESTAYFTYPFYEPGSTFLDEVVKAPASKPEGTTRKATTMSLSAITAGVELLPGDRLVAYADGEQRGAVTVADDSIFYLSIEGDVQQPLWFAIEREGDVIATTPEVLTYKANSVVGLPSAPTKIDFTVRDIPKFGWYTLEGYKLPGRPVKKGVYIYNGKKYVID